MSAIDGDKGITKDNDKDFQKALESHKSKDVTLPKTTMDGKPTTEQYHVRSDGTPVRVGDDQEEWDESDYNHEAKARTERSKAKVKRPKK